MSAEHDPVLDFVAEQLNKSDDEETEVVAAPHAEPLMKDMPPPPDPVERKSKSRSQKLKELKETADALHSINKVKEQKQERERKKIEANMKVLKDVGARKAKEAKDMELRDDAATHMSYMSTITSFRQRLGCKGTGKRVNMDSPIEIKYAELETMKEELKSRRGERLASLMPSKILNKSEEFLQRTFQDIRGLSAAWEQKLEEDELLRESIEEFSITYGTTFGTRCELYIAFAMVNCAQTTISANKMRRMQGTELPGELDRPEYDDL